MRNETISMVRPSLRQSGFCRTAGDSASGSKEKDDFILIWRQYMGYISFWEQSIILRAGEIPCTDSTAGF
jgi:hypothetical protein